MIELHAVVDGNLKLHTGKTKNIKLGYIYTANKYILSLDETTATIHFDEGIAENVQVDIFEINGLVEKDKITIKTTKPTDTTK